VQFAFGVMTRSKAITYDNLRCARRSSSPRSTRRLRAGPRQGFDVDLDKPAGADVPAVPAARDGIANRVVVSPMCMYSAVDGVPGDFHLVHYGSRAIGGAGLIFTEMTCVGRCPHHAGCTGLWNDEQEAAWRRIVDFVHANSAAKICLQLGHAGRKGATKLMWDGMDRPLEEGGWDVMSASPIPYFPTARCRAR
jgi:anthraniloyl-CoA monooxygenase